MHAAIQPLAFMFKTNAHLINKAVRDIAEEDMLVRPEEKANSLHFVMGHVAAHRYLISRLLGKEESCPWEDKFSMGVAIQPPSFYPSVREIKDSWKKISESSFQALIGAAPEQLNATATVDFGFDDKSVLSGITFLTFHETYHVGQLAYIRRLLGYECLVG